MHDTIGLEAQGVPSVYVASTEFERAGAVQARRLGLVPRSVLVAHPIQDRTDEEMRALADEAVARIVAALTSES